MLSRRPAVDLRDQVGSATHPSLPCKQNSVILRQGSTGTSSRFHKERKMRSGEQHSLCHRQILVKLLPSLISAIISWPNCLSHITYLTLLQSWVCVKPSPRRPSQKHPFLMTGQSARWIKDREDRTGPSRATLKLQNGLLVVGKVLFPSPALSWSSLTWRPQQWPPPSRVHTLLPLPVCVPFLDPAHESLCVWSMSEFLIILGYLITQTVTETEGEEMTLLGEEEIDTELTKIQKGKWQDSYC